MSSLCVSMNMRVQSLQLCLTVCNPWMQPTQTPLFMGFPRQEYWSGLPCLPTGDLPDPRIKYTSLMSPALACMFFIINTTWEGHSLNYRN